MVKDSDMVLHCIPHNLDIPYSEAKRQFNDVVNDAALNRGKSRKKSERELLTEHITCPHTVAKAVP